MGSKKLMCIFNTFGKCRSGSKCKFAHHPEELTDCKSVMCPVFQQIGSCSDPLCPFSHAFSELRLIDRIIKPTICKHWKFGRCTAGYLCRHAHGSEELSSVESRSARAVINPSSYVLQDQETRAGILWRAETSSQFQ